MEKTKYYVNGEKECTKCGEVKALNDFHKNKQGSQGRNHFCIDCNKKYYRRRMDKKGKPPRKFLYRTETHLECSNCHEIKLFKDFSKDETRLNGVTSYCKSCTNKRLKKYKKSIKPKKVKRTDGKKECAVCVKVKVLSDFGKDKKRLDGRNGVCKECRLKKEAERRKSLGAKERKKRFIGEKEQECVTCRERKTYSEFNKSSGHKTGYSGSCRDCTNTRNKKDGKASARRALRRSREIEREVQWANTEEISLWYKMRNLLSDWIGIKYHVDHIIPLCGKTVSGLHVENNLRLLKATENSRKFNKVIPELIG